MADLAVIQQAAGIRGTKIESAPVARRGAGLAGGEGDALFGRAVGHQRSVDRQHHVRTELERAARIHRQRFSVQERDGPAQDVRHAMVVPGARIGVVAPDVDGVASVAADGHGARNQVRGVGVYPDGVSAVVRDTAVADVRIGETVARVDAVAGVVVDVACGDGGRRGRSAAVVHHDSRGSAVGDVRVADGHVGARVVNMDAAPGAASVADLAVIQQAAGVCAVEIEVQPVSGSRRCLS